MSFWLQLTAAGIPDVYLPGNKELKTEIETPILYINRGCHSATILAHYNSFKLYKYKIIEESIHKIDENLPRLIQDNQTYTGKELNRKLFQNNDITNIDEDALERMILNSHKNCGCNNSDDNSD